MVNLSAWKRILIHRDVVQQGAHMKIYIGPYKNWYGPYQIAEKILFWEDKNNSDRVEHLGRLLANIHWFNNLCNWIHSKKKRKIKTEIHDYDLWSMDHTLAMIILPMLKQYKEQKNGSPFTDYEDTPHIPKEEGTDDFDRPCIHKRWDWILGEMIFAFECVIDDDWEFEDREKAEEIRLRMENGFRLFGKYYRGLWN